MESVAGGFQKDERARCQDFKMQAEERHGNICIDTAGYNRKIDITKDMLYEGDRVVERE